MTKPLPKDEIIISEVIAKAKEVFQKYGFRKTTMEDIARELGKGKSTLYYYFSSKEAIFEEVVDQEMRHFFAMIQQAVEKAGSARSKLKAYSKMRIQRIREMCNLSYALQNDLIENIRVVLAIKKKHEASHSNMVKEIVLNGIRQGELKKLCPQDIDQFSFLFVSLFKGMDLPMNTGQVIPDGNKYVDFMVDSIIDGIGRHSVKKDPCH